MHLFCGVAKSVFQVHGVDAAGQVIIRRQLKRRYVLAYFSEVTAMPGRYRSSRLVAPSVAGAAGPWLYGTADASSLRQTLCQTAEE